MCLVLQIQKFVHFMAKTLVLEKFLLLTAKNLTVDELADPLCYKQVLKNCLGFINEDRFMELQAKDEAYVFCCVLCKT